MPLVLMLFKVIKGYLLHIQLRNYILKWQGKDSKVLPKENAGTGFLKENDFIKNITLYI